MSALTKECVDHPAFTRRLEVATRRLAVLSHPPGPPVDLSWIGADAHAALKSAIVSRLDEETP